MAIVDNFVELNKQCKRLFPKVFDNASMTPSNVKQPRKTTCLKCFGAGFIIPSVRGNSTRVECDGCNGTGQIKVL